MGQAFDHNDRVTFKDVLLARRYLREMRDTGKLSPDLQAAIGRRGREHVKWVASILGRLDDRKAI